MILLMQAVIMVIDSTDAARLDIAKHELHQMMEHEVGIYIRKRLHPD